MLNSPQRLLEFGPGQNLLRRKFWREIRSQKKRHFLYFCKHRHEVDEWVELCLRHGIESLGCVGGETSQFMESLLRCPKPRAIFSTMALGHGVNLPSVDVVVLDYKIEKRDFFLQMIARAGRRGEPYQIYCLSEPEGKARFGWLIPCLKEVLWGFCGPGGQVVQSLLEWRPCKQKWKVFSFLKSRTRNAI